ncbi:MAG: DUF2071 domain-containing protein [Parachlamydia sp.]|nr:DUF2071 domain-containing protein [Parachlamydia sp.]
MYPTLDQRLTQRQKPKDSYPVLLQNWRHLLFLHWKCEPEQLQAMLPEGLFVDTFQSKAYLGIVPFFMEEIKPAFFGPLPGLNFYELNVRTYVYDREGTPGVWFFSLDASNWLAVQIARGCFHLPYQYSGFEVSQKVGQEVDFKCCRKGHAPTRLIYRFQEGKGLAEPDKLDFFLIERYILFTADKSRRLYKGQVHHQPYPLFAVEALRWDTQPFIWNNLPVLENAPDHIIASSGVDVQIYQPTLSKTR